jgi:hypothetical protein
MIDVIITLLSSLFAAFRGRKKLVAENLALRHHLMVIHRQVKRARLTNAVRSLWVILRRFWPDWDKALVLVKPATVIAWHRAGFRLYWRWKSRTKGGRPRIDRETRELIRRFLARKSDLGKRAHYGGDRESLVYSEGEEIIVGLIKE